MKLESIKIRNFRTIRTEQTIDLSNGLTIVGPNSSGKTNILKAIELVFTGYENSAGYNYDSDFSFESSGQTSIVANFSGDIQGEDSDFFVIYKELCSLLEKEIEVLPKFSLYLSFASKSSNPSYRLFSNEKYKAGAQAKFSKKQIQAINLLLNKFICHYVPSSKSINDLYSSLLLPFVKKSISKIIDEKNAEIKIKLREISSHLDSQLKIAGLGHINSEFRYPSDSLELLLGSFEFHLSDPSSTPVDRKGMGIQAASILASFLWITKEEKISKKNTIWLIEEPESYLHPQLTESCLGMLNEIAKESLLVSTTHSLGFVDKNPNKILGTEVVNAETKTKTYNNYLDATNSIRKSLGVKFSDFYNLGLINIFVEGKSDREIFNWALEKIPVEANDNHLWQYLRNADFLDFTGVSGLEGFMKATYEFIQKERPVIVVMDGDDAGQKALKNLQQYFGQKKIPFEANKEAISLPTGFTLEGLFPHDWIATAYEEHPNWFISYLIDIDGKLQSFDMKTEVSKDQLRKHLVNKAETAENYDWAEKFKKIFTVLDVELEKKYIKLYGHKMNFAT